jgi:DNA-binding transcriptional MerR regulator
MQEYFTSISSASKILDLPAHTLRYWEKSFPALVKPATGVGGRRYYRPETIAALRKIKELLHTNGYTIAGVKKLIKSGGLEVPKESSEFRVQSSENDKKSNIETIIELLESAHAALN